MNTDRIKNRIKKEKWAYIAVSILFIVLGIVIIIFPKLSSVVLCYLIGAFTVLFGVFRLIGYFVNGRYGLAFQFDLALGIISILIGLMLLIHPYGIINFLPQIVGGFLLIDSIFKFQTAFEARPCGLTDWWVFAILAVLTCGMGLLLIVNPFSGAIILMISLGISLISAGCENLYLAFRVIKFVRRQVHLNGEYDYINE